MKECGVALDEVAYHTMIVACGKCNQTQRAAAVYAEMVERGWTPSVSLLNTLMRLFTKAGQWEQAVETFHHIARTEQNPSQDSYKGLIAAFGAGGQWEKAEQVRAGVLPHVHLARSP